MSTTSYNAKLFAVTHVFCGEDLKAQDYDNFFDDPESFIESNVVWEMYEEETEQRIASILAEISEMYDDMQNRIDPDKLRSLILGGSPYPGSNCAAVKIDDDWVGYAAEAEFDRYDEPCLYFSNNDEEEFLSITMDQLAQCKFDGTYITHEDFVLRILK